VVRAVLDLRAEDFEPNLGSGTLAPLRRRMGLWARSVLRRLRRHGFKAVARAKDRPGIETVVFSTKSGLGSEGRGGLILRVHSSGLAVGLEVPPRDARSARSRLADPAREVELSSAIAALPEQFVMALAEDPLVPVAGADVNEIRSLLARAERGTRSLWIGWPLPREIAIAHAGVLDEQLGDALVALAGVFVVLSGDGEGRSRFGSLRRSGRRGLGRASNGDEELEAPEVPGALWPRTARGSRSDRIDCEGDVDGGRDTASVSPRSAVSPCTSDASALLHTGRRRLPIRRAGPARSIDRGSKVRVVEGPFAGKVGVVHEVDGRGSARVMLGLLAVRVDLDNLAPATGGSQRLRLSTSHRKPVPARS
jgi:hypothetical protein